MLLCSIHNFLLKITSVGDASAINPKCTKTVQANGVSTFFINGKPTGINGL